MTAAASKPTFAGSSDVGRVRSGNEDSLLLSPPLFAVADGLGGHQAGEVASRVAVDTLLGSAPRRADSKALGRAAKAANRAVIEAAKDGRGRAGMGTTLTAAMVDGLHIAIAHVGDSRAYLMHRDGRIERITQDHSMVADLVSQGSLTEEEARTHPNRSVITRALGSDPNMSADTLDVTARPGDRLLLATDGLTSLVPDDELADIMSRHAVAQEAVDALIAAARLAGGYDNITAVVVDLVAEGDEAAPERGERPWVRRLLWMVAIVAVIALAAGAVYRYATSRAYLVAEDGYVVVYRGVPGTVAGVSLRWRDQSSDVTVADLPAADQIDLRQGVTADSLAQAYAKLAAYRMAAAKNPSPAPGDTTIPLPGSETTSSAPSSATTPAVP